MQKETIKTGLVLKSKGEKIKKDSKKTEVFNSICALVFLKTKKQKQASVKALWNKIFN